MLCFSLLADCSIIVAAYSGYVRHVSGSSLHCYVAFLHDSDNNVSMLFNLDYIVFLFALVFLHNVLIKVNETVTLTVLKLYFFIIF